MIKSVELQNFQPHVNTKVELHPSINVIQGLSDSGKSAFLRGLDAVLRKAPFYLNWDAETGKNTIVFDNDDTISRSFTKTKIQKCPNCKEKVKSEDQVCESCGEFLSVKSSEEFYMLNDERRDRFGVKLPEFITDFTRIKPIQFLDNEIFLNFAEQHEPMFFVSDLYTGSLRNKMISTLLPDSEKIDVLIKELVSEKLSTSAQLKVYTKQQLIAEEQLNMIKSDVDLLSDDYKTIAKLANDIKLIEDNLNTLEGLEIEINKVSPVITYRPTVDNFKTKLDAAIVMIGKCQNIETGYKTLKELENSLQSLSKYDSIDMMEFALFDDVEDDINELAEKIDVGMKLMAVIAKIANIVTAEIPVFPDVEFPDSLQFKLDQLECIDYNLTTLDTRFKESTMDKQIILKEIESLKKEIDSDKMICPITNQKYCESCIETIKNDLTA